MHRPVLVTGAVGNVGGAVTRSLLASAQPVRAADRDPERVDAAFGSAVAAVRLDFEQPSTFGPALEGVGAVFLMRPPRIARVGPTLNAFVDRAFEAGVTHVVFSSVAGAENNPLLPHHRVERHLMASGSAWTLLRPGFFAQNLGGPYRDDVREDNRLYLPAGDGRVAFLDVRDLGDVAAKVFADPAPHRERAYTLTGGEAISLHQVAQVLSAHLERPITYQPATVPGYVRHLGGRGTPLPQILVQTLLHVGLRRGDAEGVEPALAQLLGRSPRTMTDYIRDHLALWGHPGSSRHAEPVR